MIVIASLILVVLVAGILVSIEAGFRIGVRGRARHSGIFQPLHPAVEGAIFGLMGLLVSFTFYGAGSRFDARRALTVRESNTISTTYLRLDLLPQESQPGLRQAFRDYLRSRLAVYEHIPDLSAVKAALDRSTAIQQSLWKDSIKAVAGVGPSEKSLFLSSLNETIDITTDSTVALTTHPPGGVFVMLALTVMISSGLVGYGMARSAARDWMSAISFTLVVSIALYVIIDYEFPRFGLLRIDPVDQVLVETLNKMK